MIRCLFDNNALADLAKSNAKAIYDLRNRIIKLSNTGKISFRFSPIAFYEQLAGVNSKESLANAQNTVKNAYSLTAAGHFLLDPVFHLKRNLSLVSKNDVINKGKMWVETFRIFIKCTNVNDFHENFGEMQSILSNQLDIIFKKSSELAQEGRNSIDFESRRSFKLFLKDRHFRNYLRKSIFESTIDHFNLSSARNYYKLSKVLRLIPSILYFVDTRLYLNWKYAAGRNPRSSDYFDLEQLIYLDICDYILTMDGGLIDILDNCGNNGLRNRALRLDFFKSDSNIANLQKRAPLTEDEVKI